MRRACVVCIWALMTVAAPPMLRSPFLLHEPHQVAVRVTNEAGPWFMVWEFRSQLGCALVGSTAGDDRRMRCHYVHSLKVEDRLVANRSRALRSTQHQANARMPDSVQRGTGRADRACLHRRRARCRGHSRQWRSDPLRKLWGGATKRCDAERLTSEARPDLPGRVLWMEGLGVIARMAVDSTRR